MILISLKRSPQKWYLQETFFSAAVMDGVLFEGSRMAQKGPGKDRGK